MGHLLSHPIEDKKIDNGSHTSLSYSVGAMQGYRMTMEDAHNIMINEEETVGVFGVFDGHGGKHVAEHVADRLVTRLFRQLNYAPSDQKLGELISQIKDQFFYVDAQLLRQGKSIQVGLTANVVIVQPGRLLCANTGDSRAVCCIDGVAKTLLFDHKPVVMGELVRIENANGYIANLRINEILALSRAFGDFSFKNRWITTSRNKYIQENMKNYHQKRIEMPPELEMVTVEPDILVHDWRVTGNQPEFLVVACDGVWDCFKSQDLVNLIRQKIAVGWLLHKIVEHVLHELLAKANLYTGIGFDNMTLVIVAIHQGRTEEEWYSMVRHRYERKRGLRK